MPFSVNKNNFKKMFYFLFSNLTRVIQEKSIFVKFLKTKYLSNIPFQYLKILPQTGTPVLRNNIGYYILGKMFYENS